MDLANCLLLIKLGHFSQRAFYYIILYFIILVKELWLPGVSGFMCFCNIDPILVNKAFICVLIAFYFLFKINHEVEVKNVFYFLYKRIFEVIPKPVIKCFNKTFVVGGNLWERAAFTAVSFPFLSVSSASN